MLLIIVSVAVNGWGDIYRMTGPRATFHFVELRAQSLNVQRSTHSYDFAIWTHN